MSQTNTDNNNNSNDSGNSNGSSNQQQQQQQQQQQDNIQYIDNKWLKSLKLSPSDHLTGELDRINCPKCGRKRKYFCYDCYIPFGDASLAPTVKLPISCDILHYPTELLSKSTAIHAKVIANQDVTIHEFPDIPEYESIDEVVLLFPSKDSSFVSEADMSKIKKVIFIDSQWHTANRILNLERVKKLKCIKIHSHKTLFWRYQKHGDEFLATIEAIYYFYKEYHMRLNNGQYNGEYDNLLYYYVLFYNLIQNTYKQSQLEFRRKDNYIQPDHNNNSGNNNEESSSSSSSSSNDKEKEKDVE